MTLYSQVLKQLRCWVIRFTCQLLPRTSDYGPISDMSWDRYCTLARFKIFFICLIASLTSWLEGSDWEFLAPRENPPYLEGQPDIKTQAAQCPVSLGNRPHLGVYTLHVDELLIQSRTEVRLGASYNLTFSNGFDSLFLYPYGSCPRRRDLQLIIDRKKWPFISRKLLPPWLFRPELGPQGERTGSQNERCKTPAREAWGGLMGAGLDSFLSWEQLWEPQSALLGVLWVLKLGKKAKRKRQSSGKSQVMRQPDSVSHFS